MRIMTQDLVQLDSESYPMSTDHSKVIKVTRQRRTPSDTVNNNTDFVFGENIKQGAQLIGIDGYWYDITNFIPHHPGGDIIKLFLRKDATAVFHGFHEKDVLKNRTPVGKYDCDTTDPTSQAFLDLHKYFRQEGFFETSLKWYAMKVAFVFSLLAMAWVFVLFCDKWFLHYLGAIFLAAFWQQSGFLMHDTMHSHVFHNRKIDNWLGTLFGTVCFGISSAWWRDEHFIHHAVTNTIDSITFQKLDPQSSEAVFAQNEKLFPFFQSYLQYFCIKIQHITFLPICVFAGRVGIIIDSFIHERRLREWIAVILHWMYTGLLLSYLPTWHEVGVFFILAASFEGILHVQLLISHYSKSFFELSDISDKINWYRMQIECNINIVTPEYLDWFHGGLNFHIEHHVFPTMPRHNYRRASKHIRKLCREHGIIYDECTWLEAIVRTLSCLKKMSKHFSLDPR